MDISKKRTKLDDRIGLYVSASAIFISVITVIFFYREIQKLKKEMSEVKTVKNEITNLNSRWGVMETSLAEISDILKKKPDAPTIKEIPNNTTVETHVQEETLEERFEEEDSDSELELELENPKV